MYLMYLKTTNTILPEGITEQDLNDEIANCK